MSGREPTQYIAEYGKAVTASFKPVQSSGRFSSSESALCHICGLCFKNLEVHMYAHNQQKLRCSQCGKQFARPANFRRHQEIHSVDKLHGCPMCGKQFRRPDMLWRHQQSHTDVKPFLCAECGKQFAYARGLRSHHRTHTGEKPFVCPECGKNFTTARSLRKHQPVHTGEKPFRCTDCGKQFARSDNLMRHQRLHPGANLFNCSHCGKQFAYSSDLRRHLRKHTGENLYECFQCGERFGSDDKLRNHQRKRHAASNNSTYSPSFGYAENNFAAEEKTSIFPTVFENSAGSSNHVQLEDLIASNSPSVLQIALDRRVDIPSFVQIRNLTGTKNPSFIDSLLEIPPDGTSLIDMDDSTVMENPFVLEKVLENPVDSSSLTQMDNPTELESRLLLHLINLADDDPSLPENPMQNSFLVHLQNRLTVEDPFLFQNPMNNPSFAEPEDDTATEKLTGSPSHIPTDARGVSKTPIGGLPLMQMQEHVLMNEESSLLDIQLPSHDSDSVPGSAYLECPVCSEQFEERAALADHMLNGSCLLFPLNWLPYVEDGDKDDSAK